MLCPDKASGRGAYTDRATPRMQNELADPYGVLGLSRTANADDLKKAYRKLSLAWHPDRHAAGTDIQRLEAERRFKLINQAYVAIGDVLRTKSAAQEASERTVIERSDSRVEAVRSVVASAALRVVPNLPRRTYLRVVNMVEFMLLDTLAVGDRAFAFGFDAAVRDALDFASLAPDSLDSCMNVLDTAVDELTWRGKGADPQTWQTLLRPLEEAMHPNRPGGGRLDRAHIAQASSAATAGASGAGPSGSASVRCRIIRAFAASVH